MHFAALAFIVLKLFFGAVSVGRGFFVASFFGWHHGCYR